MKIDDLDTPSVVIDLDTAERNIDRMQAYASEHGLGLRPHIKTHKLPALAHKQLAAGAVGIACQKVGEAEVMAAAGIRDILICYNIIGKTKLDRLARLAGEITLSVVADSAFVVDGLQDAMKRHDHRLRVLVECDTGGGRAGVPTTQEALDLAARIDKASHLDFGGLMTHPPTDETAAWFAQATRAFTSAGMRLPAISAGSTPRARTMHEVEGLTELRVGTYIYNDRMQVDLGSARWEDCAMTVLTTLVSRHGERGVLDAGSKSFSADRIKDPADVEYGRIVEHPDAKLLKSSEEHGHVHFARGDGAPRVGDRMRIIPNHACLVTNLHDTVHAVRGDDVVASWPVLARGKLQ